MFSEQQIADFKKKLQRQQTALLELKETGDDAAATVQLDQSSVGRLSRMGALQGQAMAQEQERRRALELQRIDAALRRIEAGEFGDCVRCGEEIAGKRLDLDPATPLCINCASAADDPRR